MNLVHAALRPAGPLAAERHEEEQRVRHHDGHADLRARRRAVLLFHQCVGRSATKISVEKLRSARAHHQLEKM